MDGINNVTNVENAIQLAEVKIPGEPIHEGRCCEGISEIEAGIKTNEKATDVFKCFNIVARS